MKIVFDTYAWIEYFLGNKKGKIVKNYLEVDEIITPSIVLLELSYKADKEGWDIEKYLSFIKIKSKIVGFNDDFILRFGKTYNKLKKQIKEISLPDIIIYVTALLNDAKVVTGDGHFRNLDRTVFIGEAL